MRGHIYVKLRLIPIYNYPVILSRFLVQIYLILSQPTQFYPSKITLDHMVSTLPKLSQPWPYLPIDTVSQGLSEYV